MAEKKKSAPVSTGPVKPEDKKKALETALAQIEKNFGKGAIMRLGDDIPVNVEAISTGSLSLDLALGIGGVPRGRIVEIYGPESSGKTTLALHIVASAQKKGGEVAFIDVEHALEPAYARALGVDIDSLLISQPDTGEQALEITEAARALRRARRGGRRLRGGAAAAQRARGRDGRVVRRRDRAPDEPGAAQAGRRRLPRPTASSCSSTSCARRSASCTATPRRRPAAAR